jgi:cytochrome c biogenesis protein CcmG, thiol:disulfide interchange protein DsbE
MTFTSRFTIITFTLILALGYSVWEDKKLKNSIAVESDSILTELPDVSFQYLNQDTKISIKELVKKDNKKINIVHFWGTWCGPCATEFPEMVQFINKLKSKSVSFYLIAVNDKSKAVKKFLKTFKTYEKLFTVLLDNENIHSQFFGTVRVPETYFFDQNGKILKKFKGPQDWANPYYVNYLDPLLLK